MMKVAALIAFNVVLTVACIFCPTSNAAAAPSDSVYLVAYSTLNHNSRDGLHFAWSEDRQTWQSIGKEYSFLKCDYGTWSTEKKMYTPYVFFGQDGLWHCIWSVNTTEPVMAHAASKDLIEWGRQSYLTQKMGVNCICPAVTYNKAKKLYIVSFSDKDGDHFQTTTTDFKAWSPSQPQQQGGPVGRTTLQIGDSTRTGVLSRVPRSVVEKLLQTYTINEYRSQLFAQTTQQDPIRFKGLGGLSAHIAVLPKQQKAISDMLLGVFFEDINYAADGGLYAELIQNRDFEYNPDEKGGHDRSWNAAHSWLLKGFNAVFSIDSLRPVHPNNPHYAVLTTTKPGAALLNDGYDGIVVKKGEMYNLSLFIKHIEGSAAQVEISLVDDQNAVLGATIVDASAADWKKQTAKLVATADNDHASLQLKPLLQGTYAFDMVSLFPEKTFKGHGLRSDLAQTIADIHPRFVRFPGGCVAHGDGLANIYRWKNSIGPLESRKPQRDLWGYHQSMGLGYFEYFQFCEDIGAAPVPVIAAGVCCQNSSVGGAGQQGGIPLSEMGAYIQDILDLVEYANGPADSKWGKLRAEAGHPEPFHLKYIGIGNEDLISDVFEVRFTMIFEALKKAHPEITVIGTVGPWYTGTDYEQGWQLANKLRIPMVDEHYYESPGWFIHNPDFYDHYDRRRSKVYLGEYASHLPGRPSNIETALSEALYLTNVERNADVVSMASYAPLLAKDKHTQWTPDLIYFNNTAVKLTTSYYVQQLYGLNEGDRYIASRLTLSDTAKEVALRVGCSVVKDSQTGDLIVKLVNLLPVSIHADMDWSGLVEPDTRCLKTILTGDPADKTARPVESEFHPGYLDLPAYSFTVLRFKK